MVVALSSYRSRSGSPPPREELLRALAAAAEGIKGKGQEEEEERGAGAAARAEGIPMDVERGEGEGGDELDRPSSARCVQRADLT